MPNPRDTDAPAAPKRTREKAEYRVERMKDDNPNKDMADEWYACAEGVTDTAAGLRWIKKNGEPNKTYRVARICAGPVTVSVQKVEKRTLN